MTHSKTDLRDKLSTALANAAVMYHVSHGYHWNVKGMDFREFHEFFGDIYEDVSGSLDPLAENIRKLGFDAPFMMSEFNDLATCVPEKIISSDPTRMVSSLLDVNGKLISHLVQTFDCANGCNEQGVANFIAERIDMHQKWQWQLAATLGMQVPSTSTIMIVDVESPIVPISQDGWDDELAFLDGYDQDGTAFFASGRSRELVLPTNVEAELRSLVDNYNASAQDGLKTTFAKCKTVYRRGARKYAGEMSEGTTRHRFAISRVQNFLSQIGSEKLLTTFSTDDADLLPHTHPKALSIDPLVASAAVKNGLTVTVRKPGEYKRNDDAVLDIAEFSGKGYEAVSQIKDAWIYGQSKGKSGFNTALAFALGYFVHG
jgi:starvation-inducible DNA-binding protein